MTGFEAGTCFVTRTAFKEYKEYNVKLRSL